MMYGLLYLFFLLASAVEASREKVTLFSRCLFCNDGVAKQEVLGSWRLDSGMPVGLNPFPYETTNLQGHLLRVFNLPYFPYMDFQQDLSDLSRPGVLEDCLNKRIMDAVSPFLNFTYTISAPPDLQFGTPTPNGTWTGLVGLLQTEEGDMTLMMTNSDKRNSIIDLARIITSDAAVIVSLKPRPLPTYFVIIRPFAVDVWIFLLVSIMIWTASFWMLQKLRSEATGEKSISLQGSIFYGIAVMLEDPPHNPPRHSTGQMLLGLWLLFCLVISTFFRSSLVAQLSVQSMTKPIDSFEDLLSLQNCRWGIHDTLLKAQPRLYFTNDKDPVIKEVYRKSEGIDLYEGLAKVMKGSYALIATKNRLRYIVAMTYMDGLGQTPFYIGKKDYTIASDFCRFSQVLRRLSDAGLMSYWLQDVMNSRFRQIRRITRERWRLQKQGAWEVDEFEQDRNKIVVSTRHMTGVYLAILLGYIASSVIFIAENLVNKYYLSKSSYKARR
ncbi:glutamate receptor ionotropic, kainate glr-3-like [Macrobrachium rosenbergii]|uniref:glutamate receptor ionotropic, kainate glr-3-like n=1 Tax=Macrobrachium rosenbergii TaxID=79674 RepID=UPI0034D7B0A5